MKSMGTSRRKGADQSGVTGLERRFAVAYLIDFNATEAYLSAAGKVSRGTARANGHRLLQKPEIQALIRAERDKHLDQSSITVQQTMAKLRQCLMYDVRKLFDERGNLKPMREWPADEAAAVVGVKDTQWGREIKLADKVAALEKAMKYHGLFDKDNRQKGEAIGEVLFQLVSPGGKLEPAG